MLFLRKTHYKDWYLKRKKKDKTSQTYSQLGRVFNKRRKFFQAVFKNLYF